MVALWARDNVLIVAPPRTGKTMMLQSIAQAISKAILKFI